MPPRVRTRAAAAAAATSTTNDGLGAAAAALDTNHNNKQQQDPTDSTNNRSHVNTLSNHPSSLFAAAQSQNSSTQATNGYHHHLRHNTNIPLNISMQNYQMLAAAAPGTRLLFQAHNNLQQSAMPPTTKQQQQQKPEYVAFPPPSAPPPPHAGHSLRKRKDNTSSELKQEQAVTASTAAGATAAVPALADKRIKRAAAAAATPHALQPHPSTTTGDSGFGGPAYTITIESRGSGTANGGGGGGTVGGAHKYYGDALSTSAESTSSAGVRGSLGSNALQISPAPSNRSSKYVGAHIGGQSGGLPRIAQVADDIGAKCLCLHVRNQRRWKSHPALANDAVRKFTDRIARSKTLCAGPRLLAKASSLFNLGAPGDEVLRKTRDGLQDELQRCRKLGIAYYVVAPGTTLGKCDVADCLERIAATVTAALKAVSPDVEVEEEEADDDTEMDGGRRGEVGVQILLMNMCLQGYTVGGKLQELKSIIDMVGAKERARVGVCMDVLAAYAAGYNVATADGLGKFLDDVDATVGMSRLRAVRLMDSELPIGSHLHRATSIGHGWLGLDGFRAIMNEPRLNHLPMFIDTSDTSYQRDIETLYSLCKD